MARKKWKTDPYTEGDSVWTWEGIYSAAYVNIS